MIKPNGLDPVLGWVRNVTELKPGVYLVERNSASRKAQHPGSVWNLHVVQVGVMGLYTSVGDVCRSTTWRGKGFKWTWYPRDVSFATYFEGWCQTRDEANRALVAIAEEFTR